MNLHLIRANHHHADRIAFAESLMATVYALVKVVLLVLHLHVTRNVLLARNVHKIKLVLTKNVWTRVQILVV